MKKIYPFASHTTRVRLVFLVPREAFDRVNQEAEEKSDGNISAIDVAEQRLIGLFGEMLCASHFEAVD